MEGFLLLGLLPEDQRNADLDLVPNSRFLSKNFDFLGYLKFPHEAAAKPQRKFKVREGSKARPAGLFPHLGKFLHLQEFDPSKSNAQELVLVHFEPQGLNGRVHSSRNPTDFPDFVDLSP